MRTKVFVAIPTMGNISDSQVHSMREIEARYADEIEFIYPKQCVRRIFHDFARNMMVEDFLDSDADILWFLDSDITPPKHVLDLVTLHKDKWLASGAPYPIVMCPENPNKPQIVIAVFKGLSDKGLAPSSVPMEGLDWIDGLGTGCMFLKREVFDGMQKPYFEFKYDRDVMNIIEGEDIGFCKKLAAKGVKFFVDYGMICKHYKHVCLLEMNNYAIDYGNKMVLAHDRMIRGQIQELAKAVAVKKQSSLVLPPSMFKV